VPDDVKPAFDWPSQEDRQRWLAVINSTVTWYGDPGDNLNEKLDFYRVFESIEEGEYLLTSWELIGQNIAEIHIDPEAYPYGGVGPFIALVEAFGFYVLRVNEYGKYRTRQELLAQR